MGDVNTPLLPTSPDEGQVRVCGMGEQCFLSDGSRAQQSFQKTVQRKLLAAMILCIIFMLAEVVGGYMAHSVAIMSDAAHMLSDVCGFAVSLFAAWAVARRSHHAYSFGYHRVEIIGALVSIMLIWLVTGMLVYEAVNRLINPVAVDGKLMTIVASAGIVFNLLIFLVLGVHGHLGHNCADHDHDHDHSAEHQHGHEHGHSTPGAAKPHGHSSCGHGHHHHHDHSHAGHDHRHSHDHSHAEHNHNGCSGHHHHSPACTPQQQVSNEHNHSHSGCNQDHDHHDEHDHSHDHDHDHDHHRNSHDDHGHGHQHSHDHDEQQPHGQHHVRAGSEVVITVPLAPPEVLQQADVSSRLLQEEAQVAAAASSDAAHVHSHGVCHGHGHSHSHEHSNINLRGAVVHVMGDLVQSMGVAIAGGLIWLNQGDERWYIADPICTFLFSVLVMLTTRSIIRDIVHTLMERSPATLDIQRTQRDMHGIRGVSDVHDLHVWTISTGIPILTAHVHIGVDADADDVLRQLEAYVRTLGINHSTIQICNPPSSL